MTLNNISNVAMIHPSHSILQNTRVLFAGLIGASLLAAGFLNLSSTHCDSKSSRLAQEMYCLCGNNCSCGSRCGCN